LEQLIVFLPALFAFAHYVQPTIAAGVGALFIVGRAIYFRGYVADAPKRAPGSLVSAACQAVLLLGGLIGAVVQLV
ncbi:MAG: MAPEG family protein, partial [Myxococcota bacterium]